MPAPPSLIRIPFTPELTHPSLAYALRSLSILNFTQSNELLRALQAQAIQTAIELAFQRCLTERNVPFEKTLPAPLSQPERAGLRLGGRQTAIHTRHIRSKMAMQRYTKDPSLFFEKSSPAQAIYQNDDAHSSAGLHVFALVLASFARSRREASQAIASGHPVYWLYLLPEAWRKPHRWKPLAPLSIKAKLASPLKLEIGGQDRSNHYRIASLDINTRQEASLSEAFYSLSYLHTERLPESSLEICSTPASKTMRVTPDRWRNAWIYGQEIFFTGYLERPDWLAWQSKRRDGNADQAPRLSPLENLFQRVVKWHGSVT
jgi:hypothetical protein